MSKAEKKIIEHFNKSKRFIIAVDQAIKSNNEFAEQVRNGMLSSRIAVKGTPRLYMTQMKEFEIFHQYSKEKNSLKIEYALAIAALIQQPGLLQPPSAPNINLKDLPITSIGTHNNTSAADFWNHYNSLSPENKSQVDERLVTVLDMQRVALQNLKFHLDSKSVQTQALGLNLALMEINRQIQLITTDRATPQKVYQDFKTYVGAQQTVFEDLRKENKANAPLFTSALSHLRHKMNSAHSFFSKKSPTSTQPTFVSYVKDLEAMQAKNNAPKPSLSP